MASPPLMRSPKAPTFPGSVLFSDRNTTASRSNWSKLPPAARYGATTAIATPWMYFRLSPLPVKVEGANERHDISGSVFPAPPWPGSAQDGSLCRPRKHGLVRVMPEHGFIKAFNRKLGNWRGHDNEVGHASRWCHPPVIAIRAGKFQLPLIQCWRTVRRTRHNGSAGAEARGHPWLSWHSAIRAQNTFMIRNSADTSCLNPPLTSKSWLICPSS